MVPPETVGEYVTPAEVGLKVTGDCGIYWVKVMLFALMLLCFLTLIGKLKEAKKCANKSNNNNQA